jgi:hypothetical protein
LRQFRPVARDHRRRYAVCCAGHRPEVEFPRPATQERFVEGLDDIAFRCATRPTSTLCADSPGLALTA